MKNKNADDSENVCGNNDQFPESSQTQNSDDLESQYRNLDQQCLKSACEDADDLPNRDANIDQQCPQSEIENADDTPESGSGISISRLYLRSPFGKEEKSVYRKGHSIYAAASNGKWEEVMTIFETDPDAVRAYITETWETPLHISALANNLDFVKNLVQLMFRNESQEQQNRKDLEITNKAGNTALCLAAVSGNVDIARVLMGKHPQLGGIRARGGRLPVMTAAKLGHEAMVRELREPSESAFCTVNNEAELLTLCISSDLLDIARNMIEENSELAVSGTALAMLATKPMAERSKKGMKESDSLKIQALELLEKMLELAFQDNDLNIENIVNIAPQLLLEAAEQGNFHIFKLLIHYLPGLVWQTNKGVSLFHVAVQHHHESIFALLDNMESVRKLVTTYVVEETGDNMLHLAATLAPKDKRNSVTGAAFQMQQAICWYKAVEKIVPPAYKNMRNKKGSTPADIFDQEQESLLEEGEKWMKATAKSCMLVAALNATVMFTSAFTVPGGNDNEGHPYLLNKVSFEFFSVSEGIGMLSSSTSIIMFLSILTSRVNKYAFQSSLPWKLMIGVTTLFVSIASMVIAFCTTIYLWYGNTWVSGLLLLFACVPILFICLKYRLLVDVFHLTFF